MTDHSFISLGAKIPNTQYMYICAYITAYKIHIELSLFDNVNYWLFAFGKVYLVTSEAVWKINFRYRSIIYKLIKEGQTRFIRNNVSFF